jgi:hypothetical protein
MRDRFDFEQQIMHCWNMVEETKILNQLVLEGKIEGGRMTMDEISNYLLGMESIYQHKFEQLWHDFENVFMDIVRENKILTEECTALRQQLIAKDNE